MKTRTKNFAIVLAILLALLLLCVGLFVVFEQGHDCVGDHCEICHIINLAQKIIDSFAIVGAIVFAALVATYSILRKRNVIVHSEHFTTLISLNIKHSN